MQKVIKTGHSLALTIPTKFAKIMAVKKGDSVKVDKRPDRGTLTFYFQGPHQIPLKFKD